LTNWIQKSDQKNDVIVENVVKSERKPRFLSKEKFLQVTQDLGEDIFWYDNYKNPAYDYNAIIVSGSSLHEGIMNVGVKYVLELVENKKIRKIDLSDNSLTLWDQKAFVEYLRSSSCLEVLNLSKNFLEPTFLEQLGDVLGTSKTLKELHLSDNRIYSFGPSFLKGLSENHTLVHLDLSRNPIDFVGCEVLMKAINPGEKCCLQYLDLSECRIGYYGAYCIGPWLEENKSLKTLVVNYNYILDCGLKYLTHALKKNKTLKELYLDGNCLTSSGLRAWNQLTLPSGSSLRTLSLSHNNINDVPELVNMLTRNDVIEDIDLSYNEITKITVELFELKNIKSMNLTNNKLDYQNLKQAMASNHYQNLQLDKPDVFEQKARVNASNTLNSTSSSNLLASADNAAVDDDPTAANTNNGSSSDLKLGKSFESKDSKLGSSFEDKESKLSATIASSSSNPFEEI